MARAPCYHTVFPTPREGAIWAPSGPAIDSAGHIFVSVGNGEVTQGTWDHSDSILRLSSDLHLQDGFAPTQWPHDNATDADLGSMGPSPYQQPHFCRWKVRYRLSPPCQQAGWGWWSDRPTIRLSRITFDGRCGPPRLTGLHSCQNGVQQMTVTGTQMKLGWKNNHLTLLPS